MVELRVSSKKPMATTTVKKHGRRWPYTSAGIKKMEEYREAGTKETLLEDGTCTGIILILCSSYV